MQEMKEFKAETLDDAIAAACAYYDTSRSKLEIDIVTDSSKGIFGLGRKQAQITARLRPDTANKKQQNKVSENESKPKAKRKRPENSTIAEEKVAFSDLSPQKTEQACQQARIVLTRLLKDITESPEINVSGEPGRIEVYIDDEENSGLIIGREGQTLAALQYITNRIVSKNIEGPVRIQLNTGNYREKQNENLQKLAIYLANKAKELKRPQSTKPLSSYHRRIVHMALQEDKSISTRSKGGGSLRRVVILPKRKK